MFIPCLNSSVFTSKVAEFPLCVPGFFSFQITENLHLLARGSCKYNFPSRWFTWEFVWFWPLCHKPLFTPYRWCCALQKPADASQHHLPGVRIWSFISAYQKAEMSFCFLGPTCISFLFSPTVMKWKIPSGGLSVA